MMVYGRAAERWADDIEDLIAGGVTRMMQRLNVKTKVVP